MICLIFLVNVSELEENFIIPTILLEQDQQSTFQNGMNGSPICCHLKFCLVLSLVLPHVPVIFFRLTIRVLDKARWLALSKGIFNVSFLPFLPFIYILHGRAHLLFTTVSRISIFFSLLSGGSHLTLENRLTLKYKTVFLNYSSIICKALHLVV